MIEIVKYEPKYLDGIMEIIKSEGDDWKIYWEEPNASRYRESFSYSITYLALKDGKVCAYSRSMKDALFIYVCDLLVTQNARGNGIGEMLMRCIIEDYPSYPLYIMSGSDGYYEKIKCKKEGSIYSME